MVAMVVSSFGKTLLLLLVLLLVSLPQRRTSLGVDLFLVVRGSRALRL
jgi:heme exporter protein D